MLAVTAGTTTPKIPDYLANELVASLELLRHPLPLTLRTNEASNRGGEAAIAALDAALGGYGGGSSGGGIRRLQPIPWFSNAWQVGACPGNSNSNSIIAGGRILTTVNGKIVFLGLSCALVIGRTVH